MVAHMDAFTDGAIGMAPTDARNDGKPMTILSP